MANTIFKLRRSSVAGKVPNTSTVAIGELAINLTDKILYSSDGSAVFEIGANNTNVNISNNLIVANVTTANTSGLYSTKQLYGNTLTVSTNTFTVGNSFYIISSGNVGLGVSSPNSLLHLYKPNTAANTDYIKLQMPVWSASANYLKNIMWSDGADVGGVGAYFDGTSVNMKFHSFYNSGYKTANDAIMTLMGTGYVGIGNSSPTHKLRVEGTTSITGNLSIESTGELIIANGAGIYSNGSIGANGQVLASNGSGTYWFTPIGGVLPIQKQYTANGSATSFVVTGGYVPNTISVFLNGVMLRNGTEVDVTSGSTFTISPAPANGSLIDVVGPSRLYSTGVNSIVSQQFTANGTANSFAVTGGYISNSVLVFLNGVKQIPGTDVDISTGANVGFYSTPSNGFVVDVYGYQTMVALGANAITVGSNVTIGTDSIVVGNSTVNTNITAGNIALNGSQLFIGNSTVNTVINSVSANFGTNVNISGNLVVTGTTVTVNTTTLDVKDLNITLAKGAGSAAAANGAGITIDTGYANLYYSSSANSWTSTVGLNVLNGNVGIGTSTPLASLDMGTANNGWIAVQTAVNGTYARGLTWYTSSPTDYGIYRTFGSWTASNYQQLMLRWVTGVVIDGGSSYGLSGTSIQPSGGNVAIGAAASSAIEKLYVAGNIKATGYIDANVSFRGQASDTASAPSFTWTGETSTGMFRPSANTIAFSTASSERVRIDASGNVSFGTTTTDSKLYVSGGALGNFRLFYAGSSQNFFDVDTHIFRNANASSEYLRINISGHVLPGGDNTQNLGSTTNRWANIYTGDLNLSNEGSGGNDVDGTTGSWTIQEGENDLYIINKKNGKKFKIKMEEIV